ncbi:hypothetical protein M9Y10_015716 [Tritrichomonas musculus]|uniref:DUF3447 domain-containing protein n=1 Tax=Tritrichomonas musculus TaxID=1915356 RepID=A0ABR2L429_9EUKA
MYVQEYLAKMKELQNLLLDYIDDEVNDQNKFQNLISFIKSQKIISNKHQLTELIHLIASIIDYHYRTINFYENIFNIILFIKEELKHYYTNYEIFNFFKNNKRVILFLSEENIINLEELEQIKLYYLDYMINRIDFYLFKKIKDIFRLLLIPYNKNELKNMEYKDNDLLKLIQKDLIDEFILQTNKSMIDLGKDENSSLETNIFIQKIHFAKLIEYAAFYGSIQIFKYLMIKGCILTPRLWLFAIHGRNAEIIHILEDCNIQPEDESYEKCLEFAIRCHHNEIANYILSKYIENSEISSYILKKSLKCYNYTFIQPDLINSNAFCDLCKRDYYFLAENILQNDKSIDINLLYPGKIEKTALLCAAKKGNTEIVQLLLECKDIDVNKKSSNTGEAIYESTPLFEAVLNRNHKIIHALLDCKDIDVNMKSEISGQQLTPLNIAIRNDDIESARLLIERNDMNINHKSLLFYDFYHEMYTEEATPLYQAAEYSSKEMVELLLSRKDIDVNIKSFITVEYHNDSPEFENEPDYKEDTPLYIAVSRGRKEVVCLLLSQEKIDVNIPLKMFYEDKLHVSVERCALHKAVYSGHTEIVKMLLENANIDVNAKYYNDKDKDIWSEESMKSSKMRASRYKLKEWSDCSNEKNALCIAIENGIIDTVQLLIEHPAIDVNIKSLEKSFHYSCGNEFDEKRLINLTPLYLAIQKNNIQVVQLLIAHKKIDINAKSTFYSCKFKEIELSDEQIVDKEETALHCAVSNGNLDIIKLLLKHKNIDINDIDKQGKKAIELTNNNEIISLFDE